MSDDQRRPRRRTAAGDGSARTRLVRGRIRPTRRSLLHLVLGALLYAAGANVAAGWVVAIAGLVLGVVPWAFVTAFRAAGRVEVRRSVPDRAVAGVPVEVTLEVQAPTAASIVVRDELTGAVGATGDPRDGARLVGDANLPRGVVGSGRVEVTVTDLFGLIRVSASADVPSRAEVLPGLPRVARTDVLSRRAGADDGRFLRSGHGAEVIGAREHTPGVPLRAIHWRSTARHGELVVRDLADTARPRLRIEIAAVTWSVSALDRATETTSGLAESARASGQPVEVAVDGTVLAWGHAARRFLATLPPHAGAPARPLASVPPGGDVIVRLSPAPLGDGEFGVRVAIDAGRGDQTLGVLPTDADLDVGRWLSDRLSGAVRPSAVAAGMSV